MADKTSLSSKISALKKESDKAKALASSIAEIEKHHGQGSVMRLGQQSKLNVEVISTGSIGLDLALGVGGVPKGRIVEIYGPESTGKTTIALHVVAQAQKKGEAAFIDAEHALDPVYAKALGVDVDNLLVSQPDNGEQALEITEALVRSGAMEVVVVDSVAALVPKAELDGNMGDSPVGLHARLMSQAMRKLAGYIGRFNTTVIFINQLRDIIPKAGHHGSTEITTGGRALKFYSSVRMEVKIDKRIETTEAFTGNTVRVKIVKNKVAPPFKQCLFDIMFGTGISHEGELIDLGEKLDLVRKSGTWYSYGETRLGQGRENSKNFLAEHPEISSELEALIRAGKDNITLKPENKFKNRLKGKAAKVQIEEAEEQEQSDFEDVDTEDDNNDDA